MPKNQSNQEKTIYTMMKQLPSDIWSLDNLEELVNYRNEAVVPIGLTIDKYLDYFEVNGFIEEIDLDPKYYYSPTLFAEDYYGTADLDFLVLYFAKKPTLFEFNTKKITALRPDRIKDINRIILAHKNEIKENRANPPTQY